MAQTTCMELSHLWHCSLPSTWRKHDPYATIVWKGSLRILAQRRVLFMCTNDLINSRLSSTRVFGTVLNRRENSTIDGTTTLNRSRLCCDTQYMQLYMESFLNRKAYGKFFLDRNTNHTREIDANREKIGKKGKHWWRVVEPSTLFFFFNFFF